MAKKRDFASLSAREALHVAIFIEQRNGELYHQFAELFNGFGDGDSVEIASVFLEMAEEERRHGARLQEHYFLRYGARPCSVTAEDVKELIEAPRLKDGSFFAIVRAGATSDPQNQALAVALDAELSAQRFYARLVDYTKEDDLRAIYTELAQFEDDHVSILRRRMEIVPPASAAEA